MGTQYEQLPDSLREFITRQKVFFLASASGAEVNLSPKGLDCFRILDEKTALYLDWPGSGNRTARDLKAGGRATLMFCAFEGDAMIVRLFCKGVLVEKDSPLFNDLFQRFPGVDRDSVRRMIQFHIHAVEKSCGFGVPLMTYQEDRTVLTDWAQKMAATGKLAGYIADHERPAELP